MTKVRVQHPDRAGDLLWKGVESTPVSGIVGLQDLSVLDLILEIEPETPLSILRQLLEDRVAFVPQLHSWGISDDNLVKASGSMPDYEFRRQHAAPRVTKVSYRKPMLK